MDSTVIIAAIALVVTMLIACATAVWTVASFRTSTAVLVVKIDGLCAMGKDHEGRLRKLETEFQDCPALQAYHAERAG